MTKFNFFVNGVIRAGDEADAKMYLSELFIRYVRHRYVITNEYATGRNV